MEISRYDQKLEMILRTAAHIFADKGFHSTSMRDISRATGVSLSGLYYYCQSKDELLFLIQAHCFDRVTEHLETRLRTTSHPVERLHAFIENHLAFFAANMAEMKVLSHEADSLAGTMQIQVAAKKQAYTQLARNILAEITELTSPGLPTVDLTVATYALFGMMNWIYNWYDPTGKLKVTELVENIARLFLSGYIGKQTIDETFYSSLPASDPVSFWRGARPQAS